MYQKKQYREIVDDVLSHITEGYTKERFSFNNSKHFYDFDSIPVNKSVSKLINVSGQLNGKYYEFAQDSDYSLVKNSIVWKVGSHDSNIPDENSIFEVTYIFDNNCGLTDTKTGSVLRTIVEGISREIELFYGQMQHVYDSAFIDTATGQSLDFVVSFMGIKRKGPTRASGLITFLRANDPEVITNKELILFDGRERFELKNKPIKQIISVTGSYKNKNQIFQMESDYVLESNFIQWLPHGNKPDVGKELMVEYTFYQQIKIPKSTVASTLGGDSFPPITFETMEDSFLVKTVDGKWESSVDVIAAKPGDSSNLSGGSIVVMPKPVVGIDKVVNRSRTQGGSDSESDISLRKRSRRILEEKSKATVPSLSTALESIEGVQSVVIRDMPEDEAGLVNIIIDGGNEDEIRKVIENTKAAGVYVSFQRSHPVMLDIRVLLNVTDEIENIENFVSNIEDKIRQFIGLFKIGESIILNQLVSKLVEMPNVYDVKDLVIDAVREGAEKRIDSKMQPKIVTSLNESIGEKNILINYDERAYPREIEVNFVKGKDGQKL